MIVYLYGTEGCHLCEDAMKLFQLQPEVEVIYRDIMEKTEWLERFRVRIPVVQLAQNELDWPFTLTELNEFLEKSS
ncbi:glutaredoxin family protein [Corallincola platygyrae]|uniref:Glutaredoxin family protein n=1 Tax=Corallincola platygyrae TaxID=1193278 RepID=A0ABW4XJF8_9GAMM